MRMFILAQSKRMQYFTALLARYRQRCARNSTFKSGDGTSPSICDKPVS